MSSKKTEDGWKLSEGGIRTAITVSLVTVYLLLVVFAYALINPEEIGGLLETMVNSFTTVIGVVIAFYFGASAYVEAKRINDKH